MFYKTCVSYEAPHGRNLQRFFETSSRMIMLTNAELWIVTDDGGALLFIDVQS